MLAGVPRNWKVGLQQISLRTHLAAKGNLATAGRTVTPGLHQTDTKNKTYYHVKNTARLNASEQGGRQLRREFGQLFSHKQRTTKQNTGALPPRLT